MGTSEKRIIADLMRKSRKLARIAEELAEEYGVEIDDIESEDPIGQSPEPHLNGTEKTVPQRVGQLRLYLQQHGPLKRAQILSGTGIPVGTVGALLQKHCRKNADGEWEWDEEGNE